MNFEYYQKTILKIVLKVVGKEKEREINFYDNVFSNNLNFTPIEMAYILLEIEKEFEINLNSLFEEYKEMNLDNLTNIIMKKARK